MRRVLRENGLSIVLVSLFLVFWMGQSVAGHREHNSEQREHGQPEVGYVTYLRSSHFWAATAENWESEFFQMFGYVIPAFLYQKGSSESKNPDEPEPVAGAPALLPGQYRAARRVGDRSVQRRAGGARRAAEPLLPPICHYIPVLVRVVSKLAERVPGDVSERPTLRV